MISPLRCRSGMQGLRRSLGCPLLEQRYVIRDELTIAMILTSVLHQGRSPVQGPLDRAPQGPRGAP